MKPHTTLRTIKVARTVVWAFFVLAIGAIWVCAARGNISGATWAIAIVLVEVAILRLNHGRCPPRATQRTARRISIFYLPVWFAGRTKSIFGPLFGAAVLFTAIRWATSAP